MHDWLISKKRYWGLALPIWECEKCKSYQVIGSKEELEKKTNELSEELQKIGTSMYQSQPQPTPESQEGQNEQPAEEKTDSKKGDKVEEGEVVE